MEIEIPDVESVTARMIYISFSKLHKILAKELDVPEEFKFLSGIKNMDEGFMFTFTDKDANEATLVCEVPGAESCQG